MRISLGWLEELVEIRDRQALPDALTFAGLEVERIEQLGAGLDRILVARVLSSELARCRVGATDIRTPRRRGRATGRGPCACFDDLHRRTRCTYPR